MDDKLLDEAIRLLKWAANDFDKHGISNDAWRGEYINFLDYDVNDARNKHSLPLSDDTCKECGAVHNGSSEGFPCQYTKSSKHSDDWSAVDIKDGVIQDNQNDKCPKCGKIRPENTPVWVCCCVIEVSKHFDASEYNIGWGEIYTSTPGGTVPVSALKSYK